MGGSGQLGRWRLRIIPVATRGDEVEPTPLAVPVSVQPVSPVADVVNLKLFTNARSVPHFLRGAFRDSFRVALNETVRCGQDKDRSEGGRFMLLPWMLLHRPAPRLAWWTSTEIGQDLEHTKFLKNFQNSSRGAAGSTQAETATGPHVVQLEPPSSPSASGPATSSPGKPYWKVSPWREDEGTVHDITQGRRGTWRFCGGDAVQLGGRHQAQLQSKPDCKMKKFAYLDNKKLVCTLVRVADVPKIMQEELWAHARITAHQGKIQL